MAIQRVKVEPTLWNATYLGMEGGCKDGLNGAEGPRHMAITQPCRHRRRFWPARVCDNACQHQRRLRTLAQPSARTFHPSRVSGLIHDPNWLWALPGRSLSKRSRRLPSPRVGAWKQPRTQTPAAPLAAARGKSLSSRDFLPLLPGQAAGEARPSPVSHWEAVWRSRSDSADPDQALER